MGKIEATPHLRQLVHQVQRGGSKDQPRSCQIFGFKSYSQNVNAFRCLLTFVLNLFYTIA
jgi:hypothetical protein